MVVALYKRNKNSYTLNENDEGFLVYFIQYCKGILKLQGIIEDQVDLGGRKNIISFRCHK